MMFSAVGAYANHASIFLIEKQGEQIARWHQRYMARLAAIEKAEKAKAAKSE